MKSIKPTYLILLLFTVFFVIFLKVSNPYRQYSTMQYWENATLASVAEVPEDALKAGNKNGPVLMWAAMGAKNPAIIKALVEKGADINEADGDVFKGTPLTGAAGYTKNPDIIVELIKLGADIDKRVNNQETALMIAAQYNKNTGIATTLVKLGAKLDDKNRQGITALEYAKLKNNQTVIKELESLKN